MPMPLTNIQCTFWCKPSRPIGQTTLLALQIERFGSRLRQTSVDRVVDSAPVKNPTFNEILLLPSLAIAANAAGRSVEPTGGDAGDAKVVIKAFPAWTIRAGTGRSIESPDGAIAVELIYAVTIDNDLRGARAVIQHFPTRATAGRTRRTDVSPDRTIDVKLDELVAAGRDYCGRRAVIQLLPSGT
jgi:hypothetical protein